MIQSNFMRILPLFRDVARKGFFHLLSANVLLGVFGFGSQLMVVKYLTPVELGEIKTMQSFFGVATIIAMMGLNTAVLKLCSEHRPLDERNSIYKTNLLLSAIPTVAVLGILYFCARLNMLSPDSTVNRVLPVFMFVIPATVVSSMSLVYLQALKKIRLLAAFQAGIRLLGFIVLVVLTFYFKLSGYVAASLISGYAALLPIIWILKDALQTPADLRHLSQSFYYAKWSVAANGVLALGQYADIFFLNYLVVNRADLGLYSLATLFVLGAGFITSTVQDISTPYFSEKSRRKEEFLSAVRRYQLLMVALAAVVSVVLFAIVPWFIRIVYGPTYVPAGFFFQILVLKYFLWSCYAVIGVALLGLGKMNYNFLIVSISVPVTLILTYLLIGVFGIVGAAIAQVIAHLITLVVALWISNRVLRAQFGVGLFVTPLPLSATRIVARLRGYLDT